MRAYSFVWSALNLQDRPDTKSRLEKGRNRMRRIGIQIMFLFVSAFVLGATSNAQSAAAAGHWVSAWGAAVHAPIQLPGLPCRSSGGQQNDPDGGAANSWREPCPHTPVERMRLV